jgi:hypothetical protein
MLWRSRQKSHEWYAKKTSWRRFSESCLSCSFLSYCWWAKVLNHFWKHALDWRCVGLKLWPLSTTLNFILHTAHFCIDLPTTSTYSWCVTYALDFVETRGDKSSVASEREQTFLLSDANLFYLIDGRGSIHLSSFIWILGTGFDS